jgi:hypothetical protein
MQSALRNKDKYKALCGSLKSYVSCHPHSQNVSTHVPYVKNLIVRDASLGGRNEMSDPIDRQAAIDAIEHRLAEPAYQHTGEDWYVGMNCAESEIYELPSAEPEIIRCKDCKHWRQQTNYQGVPLSFGFCESDDMWQSLYGETCEVSHIDTDDDFYCGYAERRTDE